MRKLEGVTKVPFGRVGTHGTWAVRMFDVPAIETEAAHPADARPLSTSALASVASH